MQPLDLDARGNHAPRIQCDLCGKWINAHRYGDSTPITRCRTCAVKAQREFDAMQAKVLKARAELLEVAGSPEKFDELLERSETLMKQLEKDDDH